MDAECVSESTDGHQHSQETHHGDDLSEVAADLEMPSLVQCRESVRSRSSAARDSRLILVPVGHNDLRPSLRQL